MKRIVSFSLMLCVLAASSMARTRHVDAGAGNDATGLGSQKSPYKTIKRALGIAVAGDTIAVHSGTYRMASVSPANSGRAGAYIVVRPADSEESPVLQCTDTGNDDPHPIFDLKGSSYIKFEGLVFADYQYQKSAFHIYDKAHHITVQNCTFRNVGNAERSKYDSGSVIRLQSGARDCDLVNNTFERTFGNAVALNSDTKHCLIAGNSFVELQPKIGWGDLYNTDPIGVQYCENGQHLIAFNHAVKCGTFIYLDCNASYNYIVRNEAHFCNRAVFNESGCDYNTIQENLGNQCTGNTFLTAHWLTDWSHHDRWINNVAYACEHGFLLDKQESNELRGNIGYNCKLNVEVTDSAFYIAAPTFDYNLWLTPSVARSCRLHNIDYTPKAFATRAGDEHQLSSSPLFVSVKDGSYDFQLKSSSPCRGASYRGTDMGLYPVYPYTLVGCDAEWKNTDTREVGFTAIVDTVARGKSTMLMLSLSKASTADVVVTISPVAGDARLDADFSVPLTVTFAPGETKKAVEVKAFDYADLDQLAVLRITEGRWCPTFGTPSLSAAHQGWRRSRCHPASLIHSLFFLLLRPARPPLRFTSHTPRRLHSKRQENKNLTTPARCETLSHRAGVYLSGNSVATSKQGQSL